MTFRSAICTAAAVATCALLTGGDAFAGKKKAAVTVSAKPAPAPSFNDSLLGQQATVAVPSLVKQVPVCKVIHAVTSSPCGVKSMVEKIAPKLFPFSVKKFPVNAVTLESLRKMDKDFNIDIDSYLPKDQYEIDLRIPAIRMGSVYSGRADAIAVDGQIELSIQAPERSVSAVKVVVDFTGMVILNVAPNPAKCGGPEDDGKTAKLYITPIILSTKVRDFETVRPTWTRFALTDTAVKWLANSLLKMAPAVMLGVDAFQGLKRASTDGRFQPGFEVCVGSKSDCKAKSNPAKAPAAVQIEAGELGRIDLTTGVASSPIVDDGGSSFVCKAIEAATSPYECRAPLLNRVMQNLLPLSFPLPQEIIRGTSKGKDTTTSVMVELTKASVASATANAGNYAVTTVIDELKIKNATPGNTDTPLSVKASADIHLTPTCKDGSIKLALTGTKMLNMGVANQIPRWLQEGFGRAAVNASLPTVKVCFDPLKVPYSDKVVNLCSLVEKAFQTKNVGTVGTIFAQGLFPISFEPWKVMPNEMRDAAGEMFLKDMVVTISNPVLVTGKADTASVDVTIKKSGETTQIKGLKLNLDGVANCKNAPGYIELSPSVERLSASEVLPPKWVVQSALLRLINLELGRSILEVCIHGACKGQKVNPRPPSPVSLRGPLAATDCGVSR
jgi:hypothetical protein